MYSLFVIWGYVFIVSYLRLCIHCMLYEVMFSLFVIWGYVFIVCFMRLCIHCLLYEVMYSLFVIWGYVFIVSYMRLCFHCLLFGHPFSVVRPMNFQILINSSEATLPIWTNLWWNGPWMASFQSWVRWSRLPTKMSAKQKIEKGDAILNVHCCFSISQNELKF
jgi:hypothetical protein